jgi:hypothetical protein
LRQLGPAVESVQPRDEEARVIEAELITAGVCIPKPLELLRNHRANPLNRQAHSKRFTEAGRRLRVTSVRGDKIGSDRLVSFETRVRHPLNVTLQRRPALEAMLAGDDKLCVGERRTAGAVTRKVGACRLKPFGGPGLIGTIGAKQISGAVAKLFE